MTTNVATGTFNVQMKPQGEPDASAGVSLGRMSLDKTFAGDLATASADGGVVASLHL